MIEMHQNPMHLVVTYKNSVLCSSAVEALDLHDEVSITSCQSEEADQRVIWHALHCLSEQYKKIVVPTVDTDVLVLLMSYVCQFYEKCSHFETYAHMVNSSCQYYDIIAAKSIRNQNMCCSFLSVCIHRLWHCFEFLLQGKVQSVGCVAGKWNQRWLNFRFHRVGKWAN